MNYLVIAYGDGDYWDEYFHPTELSEERCNQFLNVIRRCDSSVNTFESVFLTKEDGDERLKRYRNFCHISSEYTEEDIDKYVQNLKKNLTKKIETINRFLKDEP